MPVESSVDITLKITSPSVPECVLFEETHSVNLTGSEGIFTVDIGGGAPTANDEGLTLTQVFSNNGTAISSLSCTGLPATTSYPPAAGDSRKIYVSFVDGAQTVSFATPYVIQSVPYAIEAERLAGKSATDFLQVTSDSTQTKVNDIMAPSAYTELLALINGTSSNFLRPSGAGFTPVSAVNFNGQNLTNATGLTLSGSANRTVSVDRHPTSDTAGSQLLLQAGGASSSANDKNGGKLVLSSGTSTGTGTSAIEFQTATAAGSAGNADNAPSTKMTILGNGNVGIGTTSPGSKLDVTGDVRTTTNFSIASSSSPGGTGLLMPYFGSTPNSGPGIRWSDGTREYIRLFRKRRHGLSG